MPESRTAFQVTAHPLQSLPIVFSWRLHPFRRLTCSSSYVTTILRDVYAQGSTTSVQLRFRHCQFPALEVCLLVCLLGIVVLVVIRCHRRVHCFAGFSSCSLEQLLDVLGVALHLDAQSHQ